MATGTQTCDVVLPGYVLAERIGAGGYAEVWRAEAPGGIEKAVKVVYGYYDDEFAAQELKALERVKGVRHPFLLSLERFEVVNGRLAIITELADLSLDQRLRQCRAEGLAGIPRDELLRYMADTAEALDFLSQRHSLLHLDIKPENLLILGDHIKVADFGLVKELATRTQNSLVSGLTPTYASPEMFDDEPSAHSDQYSLAIVYQEMLVGALPFPGRTAAQLAKQHLQAEPQLAPLPPADRPIVARALAKKPSDRFPSCRAFVDALIRGTVAFSAAAPLPSPGPTTTPSAVPPAQPQPVAPPAPDDTQPPSLCTTLRRTPDKTAAEPLDNGRVDVTRPVHRGTAVLAATQAPQPAVAAPAPIVVEEIIDVAVPNPNPELSREQPTLYIAVGGVGVQLLCRLRALIARPGADTADDFEETTANIAIDTNRDELRDACSSRWESPLAPGDTLHLPLRLPKGYDDAREILGWVSRRWLYNIPRSLETRGYRPLGRVALVDHYQRVVRLIDEKLQRLATVANAVDDAGQSRDATVRVALLAGTGGGTGAGMVIDLANAVRSLAGPCNLAVEVHAYLLCTCFATNNASPLVAANTFSLLAELGHAAAAGNKGTAERTAPAQYFESPAAPFDFVYWVPARTRTADPNSSDPFEAVARYLALEQFAEARAALRSCRGSRTPREPAQGRGLVLRKLGCASLADQKRRFLGNLATELAGAVQQYWLEKDNSADWERLVRKERQAASTPRPEPEAGGECDASPAVAPANDVTPLALRGRFQEYLSLEFASQVLRQVEARLPARDDRGRPLLVAREAKQIVDAARSVLAELAARRQAEPAGQSRFTASPVLRPLIAAVSQRVIGDAVGNFDSRQSDRFLPADALDEIVHSASKQLLEDSLARPELASAITELLEADRLTSEMLQQAHVDLFQCGSDRRMLLFVPKDDSAGAIAEKLQSACPQAAVIPAAVDEVLIVSEESAISPQSVALGLERVFPGIAEAGRRLHTRTDIAWKSPVE